MDPITMMALLGFAGSLMDAGGGLMASAGKARAYETNAGIARQEADLIRQRAGLDIARKQKQAKRFMGRQVASISKAGVLLEGSPLDVIQDSAAEAEMDIMITDYNARLAVQAKMSEADQLKRAAKSERISGYVQAGSTLLTAGAGFGSELGLGGAKPNSKLASKATSSKAFSGSSSSAFHFNSSYF